MDGRQRLLQQCDIPVFKELPPPADLTGHIQSIWTLDAGGSIAAPMTSRVLPGGSADIVCTLAGSLSVTGDASLTTRRGTAVVLGPTRRGYVAEFAAGTRVIGIRIRPGMALPILDVPLIELLDSWTDLESLWGSTTFGTLAAVLEEDKGEAQARCLIDAVRSRMQASCVHGDKIVTAAVQAASDVVEVDELARFARLSVRTLQRRFAQHVGLPPKLFCRMRRFRKAIRMLQCQPTERWVDIADGCGYFDQAHFIRDFGEFARLAPSAYLKESRRKDVANFYLRREVRTREPKAYHR